MVARRRAQRGVGPPRLVVGGVVLSLEARPEIGGGCGEYRIRGLGCVWLYRSS